MTTELTTSTELEAELPDLRDRLSEVQRELAHAESEAERAREGAASGISTLADLREKSATVSTLREVQQELESQISTVETLASEARDKEAHEVFLQRAEALAVEADKAWTEYLNTYQETLKQLPAMARKIAELQNTHYKTRLEFNNLPGSLGLMQELESRGVAVAGLRRVPLDGRTLPISSGGDVRIFHGEAWDVLAALIRKANRDIAHEAETSNPLD